MSFWNRRKMFQFTGALAGLQSMWSRKALAAAPPLEMSSRLYESIGVKPIINGRGTFTIITGSQTLPEVKKAMEEASRHFVQMDELADGVGQRLAEISGAEWGLVSNGCAAAITNITCAAVAGNNPERMQRLPELTGLKNEVIIPAYSRNVYDHAVRMVGVKIIEPKTLAEFEAAFNANTAMVYILGGPGDDGPLGTRVCAAIARKHKVPLVVDAAAEILTLKPNVHLERGATAVIYSGGKCIRGPQAAGVVFGEKALLQAAWLNSAPHHAFGRSLKAGKEEIMGMLAAVEMWNKRDHKAEWAEWERRLAVIAASAEKAAAGVTTKIAQPSADLSNRSPRLTIQWDAAKMGITGAQVAKTLLDTEPRIVVAGSSENGISIVPYQTMQGDEKIIAERIAAVLSKPPKFPVPPAPEGPLANVGGQWEVTLDYFGAPAVHTVFFEQDGAKLAGTHRGEFYGGDLSGSVAGSTVRFRSGHRVHGTRLTYEFSGTVENGQMSGSVNLGEYGIAKFTGKRHQYPQPGGRNNG